MNIRDVYLKGYCDGDKLTNNEVYEAMHAYDHAAKALIALGPAFTIAFKEANKVYMWLYDVAKARGMI